MKVYYFDNKTSCGNSAPYYTALYKFSTSEGEMVGQSVHGHMTWE